MGKVGNSLAQGWLGRLAALETALKTETESVSLWQARLEAKVLRFLLARYPQGRDALQPSIPKVFISPLAFAAAPKARPVKRQRMKLLRHIARENAAARKLALSPWEQFCDDFDHRMEAQIYRNRIQNKLQRQREARLKERKREFEQRRREQKW